MRGTAFRFLLLILYGLFYASRDFVTITTHNGFASLLFQQLIAAGQATCPLHCIMTSFNTIVARSFIAIFISTISYRAKLYVLSEYDFSC